MMTIMRMIIYEQKMEYYYVLKKQRNVMFIENRE